jgi:hypothetical protein
MEELLDKLKGFILMMESTRRNRLGRYCNWALTCETLLKGVFNLKNCCILQKGGRLLCFTIIHEDGCEEQYDCSCEKTVADPHIKLYYFSDLFSKMISVSHFQLSFSSNMMIQRLSDIIDGINVSSEHIKLFDISEAETSIIDGIDPEHGAADDEEFEKEQSPDFQRIRDEFNTLICKYLKLAFTDPTSLPPFLLNSVDEGPTMPLSKLIAWLESE